MRTISLWQPWASLWINGPKIHETRHWSTAYRGPLLVHAAKRLERDHFPELISILERQYGKNWERSLPRGALLGIIELTDCVPAERIEHLGLTWDFLCGDFSPGRFAWKGDRRFPFEKPIPFRGAQGFFNVPDELLGVK